MKPNASHEDDPKVVNAAHTVFNAPRAVQDAIERCILEAANLTGTPPIGTRLSMGVWFKPLPEFRRMACIMLRQRIYRRPNKSGVLFDWLVTDGSRPVPDGKRHWRPMPLQLCAAVLGARYHTGLLKAIRDYPIE